QIFVYVGPMSAGYLEPFDLDENINIVESRLESIGLFFRSVFTKRVFLVFPPGPNSYGGFKNSLRNIAEIIATVVLSVGGGGTLQVGASYRRRGAIGAGLHKLKT